MYTREIRKAIEFAVIDCLGHTGKTIDEISNEYLEPDDAYSRKYESEPIWHDLNELHTMVAERLSLDPAQVLTNTKKDEAFRIAVNRIVDRLRNNHIISDWKKGSSVFRVVGHLPMHPHITFNARAEDLGKQFNRHISDHELQDMFIYMLDSCKDNMYKFAFVTALLEYCFGKEGQAHQDPKIDYEYLAGKFVEHYWKLARYGIRQSQNKLDLDTFQALSSMFEKEVSTSFSLAERKYQVEMANAKKDVLEQVFGHPKKHSSFVIHTFQNVSDGDIIVSDPIFYKIDDGCQCIRMNPEAMRFMRRNYEMLSYAVLTKWSIELEKMNPEKSKIMTNLTHGVASKKKSLQMPRSVAYRF